METKDFNRIPEDHIRTVGVEERLQVLVSIPTFRSSLEPRSAHLM